FGGVPPIVNSGPTLSPFNPNGPEPYRLPASGPDLKFYSLASGGAKVSNPPAGTAAPPVMNLTSQNNPYEDDPFYYKWSDASNDALLAKMTELAHIMEQEKNDTSWDAEL